MVGKHKYQYEIFTETGTVIFMGAETLQITGGQIRHGRAAKQKNLRIHCVPPSMKYKRRPLAKIPEEIRQPEGGKDLHPVYHNGKENRRKGREKIKKCIKGHSNI
jgi:hypothetical protein